MNKGLVTGILHGLSIIALAISIFLIGLALREIDRTIQVLSDRIGAVEKAR